MIFTLYYSGSEPIPFWRTLVQPGLLSVKHAFLADKCESCHTPVRGVEAAACIACHSTAAINLAKQSTAFHASIQECRGCHTEHQAAFRPTKMDHVPLLRAGTNLTHLLDSHTGSPQRITDDLVAFLGMRMSQHDQKARLVCTSCHSNADPHRGLFGRDCATCHDTDRWRIASFLHPSPTSRDCAQCHQAPPSHYMMHFEMVSKSVARQEHAQVNQCYLCHRTNSFNDIIGAGWYKHH
jgi:protein-arginine kinase activator protein McsA